MRPRSRSIRSKLEAFKRIASRSGPPSSVSVAAVLSSGFALKLLGSHRLVSSVACCSPPAVAGRPSRPAGPQRRPPTPPKSSPTRWSTAGSTTSIAWRSSTPTRSAARSCRRIVEMAAQPASFPPIAARPAVGHLPRAGDAPADRQPAEPVGGSQQPPAGWKPRSAGPRRCRRRWPSLAVVRDLDKMQFSVYDGCSLLEAVWLRDLSEWARGPQADELQQVCRLFDWVVRNIQLDAEPPSGSRNSLGRRCCRGGARRWSGPGSSSCSCGSKGSTRRSWRSPRGRGGRRRLPGRQAPPQRRSPGAWPCWSNRTTPRGCTCSSRSWACRSRRNGVRLSGTVPRKARPAAGRHARACFARCPGRRRKGKRWARQGARSGPGPRRRSSTSAPPRWPRWSPTARC